MWLPVMHRLLGSWPTTQACALTGNRTGDPLVCRALLNPLSYSSQAKPTNFIDTENSTVITRGEGGWRQIEAAKGGQLVMEGDVTWGGERTVLCTDDVLQSCALDTYIILLTNVTR